jgi:phosphoglucomutase
VDDYVKLLKSIFDFDLIKQFLKKPFRHQGASTSKPFSVRFDGLHGVTGPYARRIFVNELGLDEASAIQNCVPQPDFGGGHPDPNMTYAETLVQAVDRERIDFGAASDGDGDRNMIYGRGVDESPGNGAFVTPSDSVAIIADWADTAIPYFKDGGKIKGLARSMPTSGAIDLVAKKKGVEVFEVPTGWKFFGNLMDAGRLSICGEESFGTGSDHIREKDGIWAVVAWLNIIAAANKDKPEASIGIKEILQGHYEKYGRNIFSRYDYEEVSSDGAQKLVEHLNSLISSTSFKDTTYDSATGPFTVASVTNFSYTDPIDGSISRNQGHIIQFSDGSRFVFRLSGTGSQGATVRLYVERYTQDSKEYGKATAEGLKGLIEVALQISKLQEFLDRTKPNVIT